MMLFCCLPFKIKYSKVNTSKLIKYLDIKVKEKNLTRLILKMYIEIYVHSCLQYDENIFVKLPPYLLKIYANRFENNIVWFNIFSRKGLPKIFFKIFPYETFIYLIQVFSSQNLGFDK